MIDSEFRWDRIPYLRVCPWLHLGRSLKLALAPGAILLGMFANIVVAALIAACVTPPPQATESTSTPISTSGHAETANAETNAAVDQARVADSILRRSVDVGGSSVQSSLSRLYRPWTEIVGSAGRMIAPAPSLASRFESLTIFTGLLVVWSLFGVALCRRASAAIAGNETSSARRLINFAITRWGASLCAPLIPLGAIACLVAILVVAGWIGRIPALGGGLLAAASPFLFVIGLATACLWAATVICWPLMAAAVAADDCDSFGGLSRSYSLVTGRPCYAVCLILFSSVIGVLAFVMASWLIDFAVSFEAAWIAFGIGRGLAESWFLRATTGMADALLGGFATAYFWTSSSLIYLLLRQSVDSMPIERIALDDEDRPPRDPLPVVGIPATDANPADQS